MTRNGEEWLSLKTTNQQQHLTSCKPLERKPAHPTTTHVKFPLSQPLMLHHSPCCPFMAYLQGYSPRVGDAAPHRPPHNLLMSWAHAYQLSISQVLILVQPCSLGLYLPLRNSLQVLYGGGRRRAPLQKTLMMSSWSIKVRLHHLRAILL